MKNERFEEQGALFKPSINPMSEQLINQNLSESKSVFERLSESTVKKNKSLSKIPETPLDQMRSNKSSDKILNLSRHELKLRTSERAEVKTVK